jgi:hypothetical protein
MTDDTAFLKAILISDRGCAEDDDFAHGLLFGAGGKNARCTNRPDAFDLA